MDRHRADDRTAQGRGPGEPGPSRRARQEKTAFSFVFAVAVALAACLPCCAPQPALAAPNSISGTCYVECLNPEIDGAQGGNVFAVSFPQYGIEATGYCTSGPLYGTPVPGHYPFTGTRADDGGYLIAIDCSGAQMYPNHSSPFGPQNVGGFSIYLYGNVELVKRGPEGYAEAVPEATLAGARYELATPDGAVQAVLTTDADGRATAADVPNGTYTLRETEPSHGYGLDAGPQTVLVRGGETTRVESRESALAGAIEVAKSSSLPGVTSGNPCYSLAGAVYGVYADAACEREVQHIVTGADGRGRGEAALWPGDYWVREIEPPAGYALDKRAYPVRLSVEDCRRGVAVRADAVDEPQLAPADVAVAKVDAETGLAVPQGDAALAGAVFLVEHYAGTFATPQEAEASGLSPTLSLTVVTDESGVARIDPASLPANSAGSGLPLGTLVVREVKPPEGYLLPKDAALACPVTSAGAGPLDALFQAPAVAEQVVRGDVAVLKVGDGEGTMGEQSDKRPLAGVAFDILRAADAAPVARIVTGEDGRATTADLREDGQTGALPFGDYLVREDPATTPAGYEPAEDLHVTVAEDGRTYAYTVKNETGAVVRVVKRDAGTGERVAGRMAFRILDERRQPLAFQVGAGGPIVSEFSTDEDGVCTLPDKLNGGGVYYLQETAPPPGYVLSDKPVAFRLADRDEEGVIEVTVEDVPQTGRIEAEKVDAASGAPVAQAGIVWEVRAARDVITADGTLRARAGETVARLESDANGAAAVEGLHLGAYEIVEEQAPVGYVRAESPLAVELAYGDPAAPSVSVQVVAPNRRTAGVVELRKSDAADGRPLSGAVYEVRAARDVVLPDGSTAFAAGETACALLTDEEGRARSPQLPLGSYEVVETKAPEGYLIDPAPHLVELAYQGQDVPLVQTALDLADEAAPRRGAGRRSACGARRQNRRPPPARQARPALLAAALALAAAACAGKGRRPKRGCHPDPSLDR